MGAHQEAMRQYWSAWQAIVTADYQYNVHSLNDSYEWVLGAYWKVIQKNSFLDASDTPLQGCGVEQNKGVRQKI